MNLLAAVLAGIALGAPTADRVTAHSVRLTWTTAVPRPTAVEYGTSGAYGLYRAAPGAGVAHTLTLTGLAAATGYRVRPAGGREVEIRTAPLPSTPHRLTIGPRRGLYLDGAPFVPVLQWLQCPSLFDRERALGVDVFMGRGCSDNGDADEVAQTARRGAFSILPFDSAVAGAPGLLAWRFDDEPDQHGTKPAAIAAATARGHRARPRRLTFVTLTSGFFGPTAHAAPAPYRSYARAADVVGFDVYPVYGWCRPDLIAWQADAPRALVRLARPGEPVYSWIEAASTSSQWCRGRGVQPQELRAETWMTLVNGATAIGWFTHSWTPDYSQFRVSSAVQRELKRTARQLTTLAPALLAPPARLAVAADGGRVDAVARRLGGALYVFAVNVSRTPVRASFALAGAGDGPVQVFEEGRSVHAAGGAFSDRFAPLAVHLYVVPPAAFR
ncbi:MAG TPA: fibronectin type III domain-containing protein [Gaiellaceae bacterium]|nr:fibronectin type III domain-containing protein [Gaiellaceae bacterium]